MGQNSNDFQMNIYQLDKVYKSCKEVWKNNKNEIFAEIVLND